MSTSNTSDTDISLSLPIKLSFTALENFLNKEFGDHVISKQRANGKEVKYFKIHRIAVEESNIAPYNIELIVDVETLTTLYHKRELQISVHTLLKMDIGSQKMYIDSYHIDSKGKSWIANQLLESVVNTFIYQKLINKLDFELAPLIDDKLNEINAQLAAKLEIKQGISILGTVNNLAMTHFKIKEKNIWIIINIKGWGVIEIEDLDL